MSDTAIGKSASEAAALAAAAAAVDLALLKSKVDPLTSIPAPGPIINFVGHGATAIWDDVWGWVKGESKSAADQIKGIEVAVGTAVVNVVETYVGKTLGAISGFVNDLSDWAHTELNAVNNFAIDGLVGLSDDIVGIDNSVASIFGDLVQVGGIDIPNLEALLGDLAGQVAALPGNIFDFTKTWAIDNILDPLTAELERSVAALEAEITRTADGVITIAQTLVDDATKPLTAEIAAAVAATAAATTWIEDCGAPMCEEFGPASTLGPLLDNAALIEILQLLIGLAALADPNVDETAALLFAKTFGPGIQYTMTNWLVPLQADLSDATR